MLMVCKWLWKEPIRNSYTWGVIPVIPWKMVENITTELLIQTWDPGTDGIYGNHPSLMNFWYFLIFGVFFNPDQEFWAILSWFLGHFCSAFRGNSREARWGGALASWIQWLQVCPQPKNPEFHKVKWDCWVCKRNFGHFWLRTKHVFAKVRYENYCQRLRYLALLLEDIFFQLSPRHLGRNRFKKRRKSSCFKTFLCGFSLKNSGNVFKTLRQSPI